MFVNQTDVEIAVKTQAEGLSSNSFPVKGGKHEKKDRVIVVPAHSN
jgi:hypothetical protein